jgi:hypothetical protein
MKSKRVFFLGFLLISVTTIILGYEFNKGDNIPKGWFSAGSSPDSYEIGVEKSIGPNNSNAAYIKSIKSEIKGFGTLMQAFPAEKYLGKRIQLSGYMKSKDAAVSAGFWMRIDAKEDQKLQLGFDNMQNRAVKGNTDWKLYEVVLDIPANSGLINIGALIVGTGEIWFSSLKFEEVDKSVPTTNMLSSAKYEKSSEPVNLNFKE